MDLCRTVRVSGLLQRYPRIVWCRWSGEDQPEIIEIFDNVVTICTNVYESHSRVCDRSDFCKSLDEIDLAGGIVGTNHEDHYRDPV